jgi:hypothetical protein
MVRTVVGAIVWPIVRTVMWWTWWWHMSMIVRIIVVMIMWVIVVVVICVVVPWVIAYCPVPIIPRVVRIAPR